MFPSMKVLMVQRYAIIMIWAFDILSCIYAFVACHLRICCIYLRFCCNALFLQSLLRTKIALVHATEVDENLLKYQCIVEWTNAKRVLACLQGMDGL